MQRLLTLHLLFAGLWLGCVLTEALFERALLAGGERNMLMLAQLHKRVDLLVEVPAFLGVLVTGAVMAVGRELPGVLQTKIAIGLLAIVANLWCVVLVFRRLTAAGGGDAAEFSRIDRRQHQWGAVVLLALLVAAALGIALRP